MCYFTLTHTMGKLFQSWLNKVIEFAIKCTFFKNWYIYIYIYRERERERERQIWPHAWLVDWLSFQFCFRRPLKTKILVLYGLPKTTKFKIHMLSLVLRIFLCRLTRAGFPRRRWLLRSLAFLSDQGGSWRWWPILRERDIYIYIYIWCKTWNWLSKKCEE